MTINGQDFINTRKITILKGDTTVVAGILADLKLETIQPGVFYYWYSNTGIYSNQGGFSGNVLHGDYLEYDQEGNLITKGYFNKGLKSGTWVYWYNSGARKLIIDYNEGVQEGSEFKYSEAGKLKYSAEFKAGEMHGIQNIFKTDSTIINKYRNGKLIRTKTIDAKATSK